MEPNLPTQTTVFVPRLNPPGPDERYWIQTGYGGLSPCIHPDTSGQYGYNRGSTLPNCFAAGTEVVTDMGVKQIQDLVGKTVNVYCIDKQWHPATFNCYGLQEIYEITFNNRHTYRCTANHRWPILNYDDNYSFVETSNLSSDYLILCNNQHTTVCSIKITDTYDYVYCCNEPITHTFMLAGGEFTGNCVGYAWGRFYEILGSRPTLSTGNAGVWYSYTADGYQRSQTPQLGAVACWSKPGEAGHVAIVEQINQDGSIVMSESGWNWSKSNHSQAVETRKGTSPNWCTWSGYHFQGFIYNPAAKGLTDKLGQFLKEAESHIGEHGDWTWRVSGLSRGQPWGVAFINAVAKTVGGLVGVIFPQIYGAGNYSRIGAGDYPRIGVSRYGGQWLPGPAQGKYPTPQAGDLILFRWGPPSAYIEQDTYLSDHIGIVKKVDSSSVYTIEGSTGTYDNNTSLVKAKSYSLRYSCINGYFRPDWAKVGASAANQVGVLIGPLYDSQNTRKDALLREIGYINSSNLPSIQSSHIHLSAMNYTFLLNSLYEFGAPQLAGSASGIISNVDASNLEEVPRAIFEFLTQNGLSPAASVGILANIQGECSFDISQINSIGAAGMCQWMGTRKAQMIQTAGPNWKTNLTGQCQYLWSELTQNSYYKSRVYTPITEVPNTLDGALHAMNIFLHKFEITCVHGRGNPLSTTCDEYERRSRFCTDLWNKLIPIVSV